jgi:integrase
VLTPKEFQALVPELRLREQVMVMLAGSTGLRRSEMFALRWSDVDLQTMQVAVLTLLRPQSLREGED